MGSLPSVLSLVPQSGIQFLDIRFSIDRLGRLSRMFWEQPLPTEQPSDTTRLVNLRILREQDGVLLDPVSGHSPPEDEVYPVDRQAALQPFLGRWVPLPYFGVTAVAAGGKEVYANGPTNWARIRLVELPERDNEGNTHHAVLAFDTTLRSRDKTQPYTTLSPEDSKSAGEFSLVSDRDVLGWYLVEPWLAQWLEELLREARQAGGRRVVEAQGRACEHWARYICFLELLANAELLPRIRLIDVVSESRSYDPISVDLVLDIGNTRTCGILVEDDRASRLNLNNSYPLRLRDLGNPELTYTLPFDSRVEFSRASFGKDVLSRRSGRNAFQWPSPLRVGPEAVRLSAASRGTEGATGLSSPKRYLWDERVRTQVWRFNGVAADGVTTEPPVSGSFMAFVSEEGLVLRAQRKATQPAVRARFSRSSLMTFLLTELLLQALAQINSVEARYARSFPDVPRRLRRILLTMPPAMPLPEQRIFRERAEAAVKLAWDMRGWSGDGANASAPPEPRIVANLDEATATQLVFLYTEAAQRLKGDPGGFFALSGRHREDYGPEPSLRIASIDIGGGTTDLMICTYASDHGEHIKPKQNFREGFRIAGDEVLQEIIQTIVLPQIEEALLQAGVGDAKAMLREILGGDRGAQSEQERHLRRQFVSQVLEPIGLATVHAYEHVTDRTANEIMRSTVGEILKGRNISAPANYVQQQAARAGARSFSIESVNLSATARRMDAVVQAALGPIIADMCEVVYSFGCDWLLLSGRPSRLRAVTDLVLAKMPVPPHRVVGLHHYAAGSWYPFRDASGRVDDPKTTAAVGAMLCAMAEGRLEGFLMRTSALSMKSTARFLGRMELSGQILNSNILLEDPDREIAKQAPDSEPPEIKFEMEFRAPVSLGFRQLPLERWPAAKLYVLEYANPDSVPRLKLPLKLTILRSDTNPARIVSSSTNMEELREEFSIERIVDAADDTQMKSLVVMRLQTEQSEAGYWRDTGSLVVP
jgi:hypothetical protein